MQSDFWDKAKKAVQEKYITICKNMYLDKVMKWRLKYLSCKFTHKDNVVIKIRLGMIKSTQHQYTKFTDITGMIKKDYNKMGEKIEAVPPLLDPKLSMNVAKAQHQAYINQFNNSNLSESI